MVGDGRRPVGVWLLDLPLGAAVLLGAVLAPTDPVLATDIQSDLGAEGPIAWVSAWPGRAGSMTGAAYPFVMLGLGLLGLHELGPGTMRWWGVDLVWATVGGVAIGAGLGGCHGMARRVPADPSRAGRRTGRISCAGLSSAWPTALRT